MVIPAIEPAATVAETAPEPVAAIVVTTPPEAPQAVAAPEAPPAAEMQAVELAPAVVKEEAPEEKAAAIPETPVNLDAVLADSGLVMVQTTSTPIIVAQAEPPVKLGRPRKQQPLAQAAAEPLVMVETAK